MDLVLVAAIALLLLGDVGSVLSVLPGAGLSLVGIYLYWWHTGYSTPGFAAMMAFTLARVVAVVADYFGEALAARAGGASVRTVLLATLVSVPLLFVAGPVGLFAVVAGVVFAVEFYRTRSAGRGVRAATFAAVGFLGSAVVQFVVTLSLLVGFLLAAV
jgi:uncharacterized protein YqgC (DUF456 family)